MESLVTNRVSLNRETDVHDCQNMYAKPVTSSEDVPTWPFVTQHHCHNMHHVWCSTWQSGTNFSNPCQIFNMDKMGCLLLQEKKSRMTVVACISAAGYYMGFLQHWHTSRQASLWELSTLCTLAERHEWCEVEAQKDILLFSSMVNGLWTVMWRMAI